MQHISIIRGPLVEVVGPLRMGKVPKVQHKAVLVEQEQHLQFLGLLSHTLVAAAAAAMILGMRALVAQEVAVQEERMS